MRKFVSIIAAAALTGSIAITGAVSASANDGMGGYSIFNDQQVSAAQEIATETPAATESFTEIEQLQTETVYTEAVQFQADEAETPTEAPTEAFTEAPTEAAKPEGLAVKDFTGKWTYQLIDEAGVNVNDPKNGIIEIKEDGTFTYTDSNGKSISGTAISFNEIIAGDNYKTVTLTADGFSFTGSILYDGEVSIGAGATAKLVRSAAETVTLAAPATTVQSATTAAQTTTTAAQSTTTAPATKAANKNSSPKTGVPFPAIPAAGLAIAAIAVAFTLKKKEN
ncbi:MAG: hypothetical protein J6M48_10125 [Ruminococcus sp.]|nr:hypothetical protein [Ruminococcus sp.]